MFLAHVPRGVVAAVGEQERFGSEGIAPGCVETLATGARNRSTSPDQKTAR
jgi:hypothetical protein